MKFIPFKESPANKISYNKKGQRHGPCITYWNNGNVLREGKYLNGEEIGLWKTYYDTGKLVNKMYYIL